MVPKELEFPQESHVLEKENPETHASKKRNLSSVNIVLCVFDMSDPGAAQSYHVMGRVTS